MRFFMTFLLFMSVAAAQVLTYGSVAQSGAVIDNRNASAVYPDRHLTSDPSACAVGERYFNTATAKSRRCTATDTWSDEVGSSTGAFDPLDTTISWWREEFQTGTGANPGSARWASNAIAAGVQGYSTGDGEHPGVYTITSHITNANSGADVAFVNSATIQMYSISQGWLAHEWEYRVIFKLGSISNARVRIGLSGYAGGMVSSGGGIVFRYDTDASYADNTKNGGAGTWVAQLCNSTTGLGNGNGGQVEMGVPADTNWHTFRIKRVGAAITFQIDNGAVKTFCASGCDAQIPAGFISNYSPGLVMGFSTGGAVVHSLDFAAFKVSGLAR